MILEIKEGGYDRTQKRSIVKAISWRATGTIDTMLVSFIVTGSPLAAVSIGAFGAYH